MDKVERILKLIEEKSEALLIEYEDLVEAASNSASAAETLGSIMVLDELHSEIKIIRSEDD
jgi:hypothetical protein